MRLIISKIHALILFFGCSIKTIKNIRVSLEMRIKHIKLVSTLIDAVSTIVPLKRPLADPPFYTCSRFIIDIKKRCSYTIWAKMAVIINKMF
jgi:hypothetical protein